MVLAGCQPETASQTTSLVPSSEVRPEEPIESQGADPCRDQQSNLEYSNCWLARGAEARSEVDIAFERARQAAQETDELESWGSQTEATRHWLNDELANSQADWAAFFEHQCELERRIARGGTGSRALLAKCQERLSNQRIAELDEFQSMISGPR
ncbi:lysozyme inhibitor LprI family protein [Erythrobacter sp. EC-HK427]|uniref:lysozyme inhibitor LprI family protein n=1 Tax=Erythrobacter sp. EC-HK427 TaxID=2038396 RepID=UPI00125F29EE|nr:lysozyme inhibitor LprI family protein [Erythrobacter sp. EC-HK427]